MLKPLPDFDNQLTDWRPSREDIQFAIKQLKKYDSKEGRDFVVKERGNECAVFVNYEGFQDNENFTSVHHPRKV